MNTKRYGRIDMNRIAVLTLLGVLVFGVFYNTLGNPPTNWDDPALFANQRLHSLNVENLVDVLTFKDGATFQPIRDISYMIDFTFWKTNPVLGIHLHNILLFYFMTIALWLFLLELFKAFDVAENRAFLWGTIACVIYAVHPIHVESVAWLYARKEPLLGIFTFLSFWSFLKGRSGQTGYYLASIALLALAILSKPTALVIPAAMLVIDFALQSHRPASDFWKKRAVVFIPMLILVIPLIARLISMMSSVGGIKPYHGGSFWNNLLAVSQICISYLRLIGFTLIYTADYPITLYTEFHQWQAWLFVALNLSLILSALAAYARGRYIYAVFVAWFYIFILPVAHIFPIAQTMADRYALIPSVSWCVLLGFLISALWDKRLTLQFVSPDLPRLLAVVVFSVIVLSYAAMTIRQNTIWMSSERLWENTVSRYPNSSPGNVNLAVIYIGQGRYEAAQELCLNAIMALPYDYLAISNLALAQMMMGQYDNAVHNYQTALKLKPDLVKTKLGLANAYWAKHDTAKAYSIYTSLLQTNPELVKTSYGGLVLARLGYAAWRLGKGSDSAAYLAKADKLAGKYPAVLNDLAEVYTSMGNIDMALKAYQDLLNITKDMKLKSILRNRIAALRP